MMRCPACGCTKLRLGVVFAGEVSCSFREGGVVEVLDAPPFDSHWDDNSPCQCLECDWSGRVSDIGASVESDLILLQRTSPDPLSKRELEEIERTVLSGDCPPCISEDVRMLIGVIRQLQKHVQILETVARADSKGRLQGRLDTAVL